MTKPLAWVLLAILAHAAPLHAQSWPVKPVRMIVSSPPGGVNDTGGRVVAQSLSQLYGQSFVVDNRPGANGNIAGEACAKAVPDAYTLCFMSGVNVSLSPFAYSKLPYDPLRDFVPVAYVGGFDSVIAVHPSVPARNLRELVELARSKPGALSYASLGIGSTAHLYVEWLKAKTGAVFNHVPYKGSPATSQALIANEIQVSHFTPSVAIPQVKAGKIRLIANLGSRRVPILPDVPSFKEEGFDLDFRNWLGVYLQRGSPGEVVTRLNGDINRLLSDPQWVERYLGPIGVSPGGGTLEQFAAFLKADRETGAELAKIANLRLD